MADGSAPVAIRPAGAPAASLCVRVLAGANQGASLPLADGVWIIGSGPDADLTFAEPALAENHLTIAVDEGRIRISVTAPGLRLGSEELPAGIERDLPPLVRLTIGRTVFALGPADADWGTVAAAPPPEPYPAEATASLAAPADPASLLTAVVGIETERAAEPPAAATGALPRPGSRRLPPLLAGLAALIGAIAVLTLLLPGADAPVAEGPDPLTRARAAIALLRLPDLRAELAGHRIVITGRVASDEQRRQLTDALRRAGVVADVRVRSDSELVEQVTTVLRAFGVEAGVVFDSAGRITLVGYASDDAKVEAALGRLRRDVPGAGTVADQIVTPDRARRNLEQQLADSGLSDALKLATAPGAVIVNGTLDLARAGAWTKAAAEFREKYAEHIRLDAKVTLFSAIVPRGVRFGSNGYIILHDGKQLRVGDTLGGTGTVTAIEPRRLRLRTANGELELPYAQTPYWIMEDAGE